MKNETNYRTSFAAAGGLCNTRINRTEVEALLALAEYEAVNKSEAVRLAIREAAGRRGLWPQPATERKNDNR